jgi:AcrR family transcriptional regulator
MFAARGFHGVSVDELGAAVGISGPAVYRHFAGKEALLSEMLVGISRHLLAGGLARREEAGEPVELLHRLLDFHIDFALTNPDLITVHDRDLGNLGEQDRHEVRRLQRAYVEIWVGVLQQVRAQPAAEARAAAHATFGMLNSTPHIRAGDSTDTAAVAELLHRMAFAALTA